MFLNCPSSDLCRGLSEAFILHPVKSYLDTLSLGDESFHLSTEGRDCPSPQDLTVELRPSPAVRVDEEP